MNVCLSDQKKVCSPMKTKCLPILYALATALSQVMSLREWLCKRPKTLLSVLRKLLLGRSERTQLFGLKRHIPLFLPGEWFYQAMLKQFSLYKIHLTPLSPFLLPVAMLLSRILKVSCLASVMPSHIPFEQGKSASRKVWSETPFTTLEAFGSQYVARLLV